MIHLPARFPTAITIKYEEANEDVTISGMASVNTFWIMGLATDMRPIRPIRAPQLLCRDCNRTLFWTGFRNYVLDQVNTVYLDYFASICILDLKLCPLPGQFYEPWHTNWMYWTVSFLCNIVKIIYILCRYHYRYLNFHHRLEMCEHKENCYC